MNENKKTDCVRMKDKNKHARVPKNIQTKENARTSKQTEGKTKQNKKNKRRTEQKEEQMKDKT